jgi:hypothetical protein
VHNLGIQYLHGRQRPNRDDAKCSEEPTW